MKRCLHVSSTTAHVVTLDGLNPSLVTHYPYSSAVHELMHADNWALLCRRGPVIEPWDFPLLCLARSTQIQEYRWLSDIPFPPAPNTKPNTSRLILSEIFGTVHAQLSIPSETVLTKLQHTVRRVLIRRSIEKHSYNGIF